MYKLDDIVDEFLDEHDMPENRRKRVYTISVSGLRELAMDVSASPKSIELDIDANTDSVILPSGFLDYISINLVGAEGQLLGLGKNNKINLAQTFSDCGVPTRYVPQPNTLSQGSFGGYVGNQNYLGQHYRNGENFGNYPNIGGHNMLGQYRIDYGTNRILLSGIGYSTKIILEYVCDLQVENEDFLVHPYIINALKTWTKWQLGTGDEMAYRRAIQQAVHRFNVGTMQEWVDAIRSRASGVPKW